MTSEAKSKGHNSIPVFLVNLDRNPERLESAKRQLDALGVPFERIAAVDGSRLSAAEVRGAVNRFRWRCAVGRPVRLGEIGCAMSHHAIYRRMIRENIPVVCILEDDVLLEPTFPEQLGRVTAWMNPALPQVVMLSYYKTGEINTAFEIRPSVMGMYTDGYVITLPAAKALLKANWPLKTPCDHWWRWVRQKIIFFYHAFPSVCVQDRGQFGSLITNPASVKIKELPRPKRLLHKAVRLVETAIDRLLP